MTFLFSWVNTVPALMMRMAMVLQTLHHHPHRSLLHHHHHYHDCPISTTQQCYSNTQH
jgi:hypothetical protein